ncbi:MAG: hypothetical protein ACREQL_10150 [Candidatus Binatia bacterium]
MGVERQHLARGIVQEGDTLLVEDPAGNVTVDLEGWQPLPDPPAGLIVLRRYAGERGELRLLDRRGHPVGTVEIPQAWTGFATDAGVVLVPQSLHAPGRPHWLKFLSHTGELRVEVREELTLVGWAVAPGGGLATVSQAPGDGTAWVILGYDRQGAEIWRHEITGVTPPDALLTAGGQLVVLEHDRAAGASTVTILARGRGPKSFRLWSLSRIVADPDSARVAAVGRDTIALFDARTRRLLWRRDERIDFVLYGGLRFDRHAPRLLVVAADRDRRAGKARLGLRSYRLSDGAEDRAALGQTAMDALPTVVDIETPREGGRRVLLHDRSVTAVPEGAP